MFDSLPSASQHIRPGAVRAIAVSGERRNPAFPSVPTMAESGFPELVAYTWFGVSGPASLPREIVARLHSEIMAILRSPVVVERWAQMGADPSFKTPAAYAAFVKAKYEAWRPVIAGSGATAD